MSWENSNFSDVVNDITGGNVKFQSSEYLSAGKYPIIDQGEKEIGGYTNQEDIVNRKKDVVVFGDHTKCLKFIDYDFCLGADGVKVLEPVNELDTKFLYFYLSTITLPNVGYSRHFKFLKEIQIPLPPLPIQKRIAEILDAADALRRKDQELLHKYEELAQAIFIDMFGDPVKNEKGWEVKTIGDVCYSVKDGPHVSPKYTKTGIPFISVNNIINGVIDISNCKYISQEDFEIYSKKGKPEKEDILYTKGGTTGFAKRVDVDFEFSQWVHVALLKFNHDIINSAFFEYMLNNSFCYNQSQLRTKGIANRDLVLGEMKKIQILLPPIQKQREFESKILLLEKARKGNFESIDRSSSLFDSLLQQAFKGELVK